MKTTKLTLCFAALIGSASLAFADRGRDGGGDESEGGDKTFGDGSLPEFLAKYDLDGDGALNEEERQAAKEDRKTRAQERRESWDTDGDGEISDEEREAARDALRAKIEERRNERFAEADSDDDGALSTEEFAAIGAIARLAERRPEAAEKIFSRLDADDSGSISAEEFTSHLGHRRHHGGRDHHDGGDDDAEEGGEEGAEE